MKFQASGHILGLYSPVCVGPGQKPRRPVFSERGSNQPPQMFLVPMGQVLTHISLASFLWDIGKQISPRCDAAKHDVPSGISLFAFMNFIEKRNKDKKKN